MSYLTPRNVLILIVAGIVIVIIAVLLAKITNMLISERRLRQYNASIEGVEFEDDPYDESERQALEEAYANEPEIEDPAADITMSRMDWASIQEFARMKMRAEKPHLYALDWYEVSRREFSLWAAGQALIQAEWYNATNGGWPDAA